MNNMTRRFDHCIRSRVVRIALISMWVYGDKKQTHAQAWNPFEDALEVVVPRRVGVHVVLKYMLAVPLIT